MKRNSFARDLAGFKKHVLSMIIEFEEREALYIRRIRVEVDGPRFKLCINKQRNKWADDRRSEEAENESKKNFERWFMVAFTSFWMRQRICKFYFEVDIRHGGVDLKAYDWGVFPVPNHPMFLQTIADFGRNGTVAEHQGSLYDDPSTWNGNDVETPEFKPLSVLIRSYVDEGAQKIDGGSVVEFYEPPQEEP